MAKQRIKANMDREIGGERIILRPLIDDDIAAIEPWYQGALPRAHVVSDGKSSVGRGPSLDLGRAGALPYGMAGEAVHLTITRRSDDTPIGLLDFRLNNPAPDWLTIGFLEVAAAERGRGYGSEAVRLLEEATQGRGWARRFLAPVGLDNGLALYFWLRLGYRPARPGEVPWPGQPPHDIIAMVRMAQRKT